MGDKSSARGATYFASFSHRSNRLSSSYLASSSVYKTGLRHSFKPSTPSTKKHGQRGRCTSLPNCQLSDWGGNDVLSGPSSQQVGYNAFLRVTKNIGCQHHILSRVSGAAAAIQNLLGSTNGVLALSIALSTREEIVVHLSGSTYLDAPSTFISIHENSNLEC